MTFPLPLQYLNCSLQIEFLRDLFGVHIVLRYISASFLSLKTPRVEISTHLGLLTAQHPVDVLVTLFLLSAYRVDCDNPAHQEVNRVIKISICIYFSTQWNDQPFDIIIQSAFFFIKVWDLGDEAGQRLVLVILLYWNLDLTKKTFTWHW